MITQRRWPNGSVLNVCMCARARSQIANNRSVHFICDLYHFFLKLNNNYDVVIHTMYAVLLLLLTPYARAFGENFPSFRLKPIRLSITTTYDVFWKYKSARPRNNKKTKYKPERVSDDRTHSVYNAVLIRFLCYCVFFLSFVRSSVSRTKDVRMSFICLYRISRIADEEPSKYLH